MLYSTQYNQLRVVAMHPFFLYLLAKYQALWMKKEEITTATQEHNRVGAQLCRSSQPLRESDNGLALLPSKCTCSHSTKILQKL